MNILAWNNEIGLFRYFVGLREEVMINGDSWGIRIPLSEVKFLDFWKTNYCESIYQGCFHKSRTKVRGSKMIRYHRSLNHKLCRQGIGGVSLRLHQHLMRNHKSLGSGGSMVARLKLKEIDGRAPPGVEPAA